MSKKVLGSIGPPASERKTDKATMRRLLEMSPYTLHKKRDLDLYIKDDPEKKGEILVLDNELAIIPPLMMLLFVKVPQLRKW